MLPYDQHIPAGVRDGAPLTARDYAMGHWIKAAELRDMVEWLSQ